MHSSNLPMLPNSSDDELPLPLLVAQKWHFPLAYVHFDNTIFYAIQDWIKGLTGTDNPSRTWSDAKRSIKQVQLFDSIVELPYRARDGKTYQVEHTNDQGLYIIARTTLHLCAHPRPTARCHDGREVDAARGDPVGQAESSPPSTATVGGGQSLRVAPVQASFAAARDSTRHPA